MKKILFVALMAIFTLGATAQTKVDAPAAKTGTTVTIQTNASKNCQKCVDRFKENVPFFKGVKDYTYDKTTAKLTVTYDAKKTTPDQIRQQVSDLGYDADNFKANAAARAKLPACCRNAGTCADSKTAAPAHQCQGAANGQHKCQGAANGEHKCQGAANGQHQCQGAANGQHKCQGAANGEHKCQGAANGEHKCQGAANGEHKCQGAANGEHKCPHATK
ncbi:MAG: heavy-metal-associated domain-containing protein [Bacteroidales bacterium]|nr:heavy-metal-associated domain-containing protein [Bacteroidales bacterium]